MGLCFFLGCMWGVCVRFIQVVRCGWVGCLCVCSGSAVCGVMIVRCGVATGVAWPRGLAGLRNGLRIVPRAKKSAWSSGDDAKVYSYVLRMYVYNTY